MEQRDVYAALDRFLNGLRGTPRRVLLAVPDFTRFHSGAGSVASYIYRELGAETDLLEALGTHAPMTREECAVMYGGIPFGRFIPHNWRTDTVKLGEVPAAFVREVSEGVMDEPIDIEVNRRLLDGYGLIISVGQVVPHEVAGMANHAKNIFVGCGGASMIHGTHILGAFAGIERVMGETDTPVRRVFDCAAEQTGLPVHYILTVIGADGGMAGLFTGQGRECFEEAAALSRRENITVLDKPVQTVVANLDEKVFKSAWLGNKAVYRTRMAVADGGRLVILAPGLERFGEDGEIDTLIRKYGYCGREEVIRLFKEREDLRANPAAAAHLIHGSGDRRFSITYCAGRLTEAEVTGAGYNYMPYGEAAERYGALTPGYNRLADGEEAYYIQNPALGLWRAGR